MAARAVVLAPVDEDYGLVAAEAMAAGTPIITTSDSGGIAEQVVDNRTGRIVHPKVPLLAAAMRSLMTNPSRAEQMGRAARDTVRDLSWAPMLELIDHVTDSTVRPRVLLVSTFPADPVQSGGQRRLRGMANGLAANGWQPTVLSLTNRLAPGGLRRRRTSDGVVHVMVGRSHAHLEADFLMATLLGSPVDDVASTELWPATPGFGDELRAQLDTADAVVLSHPFLASALPDGELPPIVYDAFNVETDLKGSLFADREGGDWVARRAATSEAEAIRRASLVCATSNADLDRFGDLGLLSHETPTVMAANPLAADVTEPRTPAERVSARQRFLLDVGHPNDDRPIVLFLGSDHPPNRRAAAHCVDLANARPDLHVVVGGTVDLAALEAGTGPNATLLGSFPATDLRRLQTMADVVVNPVEEGSGTSLKLIDPLSLGIPVVATPVGARGIHEPERCIWLTGPDASDLGTVIDQLLADPETADRRADAGRAIAVGARPERAMRALSEAMRALLQPPTNSSR
jgi:glycosyltransferase involved in cell wall biosynthesis